MDQCTGGAFRCGPERSLTRSVNDSEDTGRLRTPRSPAGSGPTFPTSTQTWTGREHREWPTTSVWITHAASSRCCKPPTTSFVRGIHLRGTL